MSVSPFPPPDPAQRTPADGPSMRDTHDSYPAGAPSSSHAHIANEEPFSSAAAYRSSMSPVASPQPRPISSSAPNGFAAGPTPAGYERPHPAKSPPPASSLVIQDPASSPAPMTASTAQRANTATARSARSSKRDGTASISKSARSSATSWYPGSPNSPTRVPSRNAFLYILISTIEAAIIITLVAFIFARIVTEVDDFSQNLKTVSVYLAVFVFGCVFQVIISYDAVRLKNTMQLIGVLIFNIALTVTAALEIRQIRDALNAQDAIEGGIPCADDPNQLCAARNLFPTVERYLIAVSGVCFLAEFFLAAMTYKLWKDFGWIIYQKIGADLRVRRMFFWYQLFIVFLKFAFFFGVGFTVIYLILVAQTTDWEYAVTIAAVPVAMVALFAAGFAVRREWTSLMVVSLFLMIVGLVYFVYKLTQVWLPATRDEYTYVRMTITFISGFAILMLALTLLNGFVCLFNFHKGLKPAHDAIGTFGGVHRQRARKDKDTGNNDDGNADLDGTVDAEKQPNGHRGSVVDSRRTSMLQSPGYSSYAEAPMQGRRMSTQPIYEANHGSAVPPALQPGGIASPIPHHAVSPTQSPPPTALHPQYGYPQQIPPQAYQPQAQPIAESTPLKPTASRVSLD
uniref:Uncharacterized protein n=1 Tax=Kalmanozyma brasiliensis (strain GHG001) TaxID=1365824 RepID=V5EGI8_KALBG